MKDLQSLLDEIEDDLGLDVYSIYGGGSHFAAEAVVTHFILALVFAYVAELSGLAGLAHQHRQKFKEFVRRVRDGDDLSNLYKETSELREQIAAMADGAQTQHEKAARDAVQAQLIEDVGLSTAKAEKYAEKIQKRTVDFLDSDERP